MTINADKFREHLAHEARKRDQSYESYHRQILLRKTVDPEEIWANKELVSCTPTTENAAQLIFPHKTNIITTSLFYDRLYVYLSEYDASYNRITDDELFRKYYQMQPKELLELVSLGRVVIQLPLQIDRFNNFMLEKFVFPLLTQKLPHISFEGHAIICQTWQVRCNAFPDTKHKTYGFLMDICGAMGIGANLVRPEMDTDLWDRREFIFELLSIDEIQTLFHASDISLNDFFVASDIDYDSIKSLNEYLIAFANIDRKKLFSLYKSAANEDFYKEIEHINNLVRRVSDKMDQQHIFKKVLSAPITLAYLFLTEVFWSSIPMGGALKTMADEQLEPVIKREKSRIVDMFMERWQSRPEWLSEKWFPEVLELTKIKKVLKDNA